MEYSKAKKYLGIDSNTKELTKDAIRNSYKNKINMIKIGDYSYDDKLILLQYAKAAYNLLKKTIISKPEQNQLSNIQSYYKSASQNNSMIYIKKNTYLMKSEINTNINGKQNIEKRYYIVENNKKKEIDEKKYLACLAKRN
jgi:hypothetical protein